MTAGQVRFGVAMLVGSHCDYDAGHVLPTLLKMLPAAHQTASNRASGE